MDSNRINLKNFSFLELKEFVVGDLLEPKFRAKQLWEWLYRGVENFEQMTNISKTIRLKLEKIAYISTLFIKEKLVSKIDSTIKYLFFLEDGSFIETVLMKYDSHYSVCISTQVGCKMNCAFCASSKNGWVRNLLVSEMVDQILCVLNDNKDIKRISNVVLMEIGEPLDNFENVVKFLSILNDANGFSIGHRNVCVSTCGLVDKIAKLAENNFKITLSVSLHAPTDEIRNSLMPINKSFNIKSLINTIKNYQEVTKRRVCFEYLLIKGLNDSPNDAKKLLLLLKGIISHVNLINVNPIFESNFQKSDKNDVINFIKILKANSITVTVRRKLGSDINAACGQLRIKNLSINSSN